MNVANLIEWLKTQDQDAIVEVVTETGHDGWSGPKHKMVEFHGTPDQTNYIDFRKNPLVKPDHPYFGKQILELGNI